jgi:hypothetical protein
MQASHGTGHDFATGVPAQEAKSCMFVKLLPIHRNLPTVTPLPICAVPDIPALDLVFGRMLGAKITHDLLKPQGTILGNYKPCQIPNTR